VEKLLALGQRVRAVDNFSTGHRKNLAPFSDRIELIEGDVADVSTCKEACNEIDFVLHQAALGSVPRSIKDPLSSHRANVDGFINMLVAARDKGVKRFVYASSSSVYGDEPTLPKTEEKIGEPLSPYAATKRINEIYAHLFQRSYGLESVGLRYFNVFGRRQDPQGAYAAVIPRWIGELLMGKKCVIYGDGSTSRDFCYIDNTIQANLLAATCPAEHTNEVYNVGCAERTDLKHLYAMICDAIGAHVPSVLGRRVSYQAERPGDVPHSLAAIAKIADRLGYAPTHQIAEGMVETVNWYVAAASRIS